MGPCPTPPSQHLSRTMLAHGGWTADPGVGVHTSSTCVCVVGAGGRPCGRATTPRCSRGAGFSFFVLCACRVFSGPFPSLPVTVPAPLPWVRPPAASHPPRASRWGVDGTVVCVLHRAGSCRGGLATPALGAPSHRPSQGLVASCWPRYARTTRGVCGGWLARQPRSLLEPAPWRCGSASRASSSSWCLQPF